MIKFTGRFYFKLTDSKNLIGEFSNNRATCKRNYTESAVPKPPSSTDAKSKNPPDDKFVGEYFSTWFDENDHESVLADLKIEKKQSCQNIFSLTWKILDGKNRDISFLGEGMLCDGILIGDFRNFGEI